MASGTHADGRIYCGLHLGGGAALREVDGARRIGETAEELRACRDTGILGLHVTCTVPKLGPVMDGVLDEESNTVSVEGLTGTNIRQPRSLWDILSKGSSMLRIVSPLILLSNLLVAPVQADSYYEDYAKLRDDFDKFNKQVHEKVDGVNKKFEKALNDYKKCSSEGWRVVFVSVVADLDDRRLALEELKRAALDKAGQQNDRWLDIARKHSISSVGANENIEDFVIWYSNHTQFMKIGPLQDLTNYVRGYEDLSETYRKMVLSCEGKSGDIQQFDIVQSGIRGLLDGISSYLRK